MPLIDNSGLFESEDREGQCSSIMAFLPMPDRRIESCGNIGCVCSSFVEAEFGRTLSGGALEGIVGQFVWGCI